MASALDETIALENWKVEQFMLLGLSNYDAHVAVDDHVDYHYVERLVNAGCPVETAVRIVQ